MGCQKYQVSELVWVTSNVWCFSEWFFSLIPKHVADIHENNEVLSTGRWMLKKLSDFFFPLFSVSDSLPALVLTVLFFYI